MMLVQRAREAMQQLLVWSRVCHPGPVSPPRKLALVLVANDAASFLHGSVLDRLTTESSALGISIVYTSAIDGVVHVIEQIESGDSTMDTDD